MGDGGALNLREVLRQLGIKDVSELEILKAIQPTLPIGDAGALTSPLLPPLAWTGGAPAVAATTRATLQVQSLGPGGCFLRSVVASSATATGFAWGILAAPLAETAGASCNLYDMAPDPVLSVCRQIGTTDRLLVQDYPNVTTPSRVAHTISDLVFIPRGSYFAIQCITLNTVAVFAAVIQDAPTAALTPSG